MNNNEKEPLKPCPFCGELPAWGPWLNEPNDPASFSCGECKCSALGPDEDEGVISDNWNHRPEEDRLKALLCAQCVNVPNSTHPDKDSGKCDVVCAWSFGDGFDLISAEEGRVREEIETHKLKVGIATLREIIEELEQTIRATSDIITLMKIEIEEHSAFTPKGNG